MSAGQDLSFRSGIRNPSDRSLWIWPRKKPRSRRKPRRAPRSPRRRGNHRFTVDGSADLYSSRNPVTTAIRPSILLGLFALWERINGPAISAFASRKRKEYLCFTRPPLSPLTKGGNVVACEWANGTPRAHCDALVWPRTHHSISNPDQTDRRLFSSPLRKGARGVASFAFLELFRSS
jgi:hypothetical protein